MCAATAKAAPYHRFLLSTGLLVLVTFALAPAALGQDPIRQAGVVQCFNQATKHHVQSGIVISASVKNFAPLSVRALIESNMLPDEKSDNKSKSSKARKRADDEKDKSSKKDDDDDDDEKDKTSKKSEKLAKAKKQDDDDDDALKVKDKSEKKSKKDKAREESASAADAALSKVENNVKASTAPETKPVAPATKGLSAKASYITLADALKRAQAEGGSGEVLQIDLEWDEARSTVTWDLTFSSGTEYEVDAISGNFLGAKAKGTGKLALLAPLALGDRGLLTFQEIIRRAEAERGQSVMEMELKRAKDRQETRFEVVLADGTAHFYDATTGKALTGM